MYGINLVTVANVLVVAVAGNALFSKNGAVNSIYQEIIKYSVQQDIEMVKVLMRSLAQQNQQAYKDVVEILQENFSEQDLQDILPS